MLQLRCCNASLIRKPISWNFIPPKRQVHPFKKESSCVQFSSVSSSVTVLKIMSQNRKQRRKDAYIAAHWCVLALPVTCFGACVFAVRLHGRSVVHACANQTQGAPRRTRRKRSVLKSSTYVSFQRNSVHVQYSTSGEKKRICVQWGKKGSKRGRRYFRVNNHPWQELCSTPGPPCTHKTQSRLSFAGPRAIPCRHPHE